MSVGIDDSTLYKARKREPEFDRAFINAGKRIVDPGNVVDIETFVRDKDFLGLGVRGLDEDGTLYPKVLDELKAINSGDYSLVILAGGIGGAKTFTASISLVYQMYRLMMQPDPHASVGMDPNSPIIFAVQNKNTRLAIRNDYSLCRRLIERSPVFQREFPHDHKTKSRLRFLKHPIELWPVGTPDSLIGMNLHSVLIDEANFHDVTEKSKRAVEGTTYDAARESFEGVIRRKLSRFEANTGMIFVASSRRYKGEFTSQLQDEYADDPHCYLYDHTAWSINPEAYEGKERFAVFIGDQTRSARVLGKDEETHPADRHLIIHVPVKFKRQFASNCTRSLQDLAGVAIERIGSYFTDRKALHDAGSLRNVLMNSPEVVQDAMLLFPGLVTLDEPDSPRAVHADLSLSGDKTGLCIAHLRGYDDEGRPLIDVDGLARVAPPRHGQISIDSIFRLVATWKAHGVPIQWFSADGFQSADLLQRISRLGIRAGKLSVDMTSPTDPCAAYESLRLAVIEQRVRFPADDTVVAELLQLELDQKKQRIDHPPTGSKDTADALAGAVYQLSRLPAWQLVGTVPNATYAAAIQNPALGGTVTEVPLNESGAMSMIKALRGMPTRQ
jgi:hypothetical protein